MLLQNLIEEAICRIIVICSIAMKLFLFKEHIVQCVNNGQWLNLRWQLGKHIGVWQSQQRPYSPCKLGELCRVMRHIEVWVLYTCNEKSCLCQINSCVFCRQECFKRSIR